MTPFLITFWTPLGGPSGLQNAGFWPKKGPKKGPKNDHFWGSETTPKPWISVEIHDQLVTKSEKTRQKVTFSLFRKTASSSVIY